MSSSPDPPRDQRPLLIYDGDCSFCRYWIDAWRSVTGERVEYAPYQDVASRFLPPPSPAETEARQAAPGPVIPLEAFRRSVQLVLPEGKVYSAAEAVFRTLACAPGWGWMLGVYHAVPGVAPISEAVYRQIGAHRDLAYKLNRLLWGKQFVPSRHSLTRWLFLRCLGMIYLIAFLSFGVQYKGLIGGQGIEPAARFLSSLAADFGPERHWLFPTLAWIDSSDPFLGFLTWGGAVLSLLVILGIATGPGLVGAWVFYLSVVTVGGDFMSFQWDILLLEAGFLAVFFAPWCWAESPWRRRKESPPSSTVLWLLRWLLFRLMFLSGTVKLQSGDPAWRNLTALDFHYYTQPLPTPVAWYMSQLPGWFQKLSVLFVFAVEIGVPFLFLAPRRLRQAGAALAALLLALIALTGNYTFFNLLTLALCLLLLDDRSVSRVLPRWLAQRIAAPDGAGARTASEATPDTARPWRGRRFITAAVGIVILIASGAQVGGRFLGGHAVPRPARQLEDWLEPFHIVNGYGLFAVMTTSRLEIVVQGSNDGLTWLDYEFKYKPGDLKRAPPWVAPYQPRLDWQMWFAALGNYQESPWFVNFMVRLMQGSPPVLDLLARNPFPAAPPRYVRALIYDYHFTDFSERRATGDWWRRELRGLYFPPSALRAKE